MVMRYWLDLFWDNNGNQKHIGQPGPKRHYAYEKYVYGFNELKIATKQNWNYVWVEPQWTIQPKAKKKTNSGSETNSKQAGKKYNSKTA